MARGLAARLTAGGHGIEIVGHSTQQGEQFASLLAGTGATSTTLDAAQGDIVILALWYSAARDLVADQADRLAGRILVDITNPVDTATFDGLVTPAGSSAAEQLAALAPGASVVKAFNTTFAGTLIDGQVNGQPLDVFLASDADHAKAQVMDLVNSSGLRALDAGPLRRARELEALGFLHMAIQGQFGGAYSTTVKILS
jgi:predicted dinucleotide-binding enzyme